MNKIFYIIKILLLSLLFICIFFYSNYQYTYAMDSSQIIGMDGYGTQEFPYLIDSIDDINYLRDTINSGDNLIGVWFALTDDLDFGGLEIEPLSDYTNGMTFGGGFDGRGHTISNFSIDTEHASF